VIALDAGELGEQRRELVTVMVGHEAGEFGIALRGLALDRDCAGEQVGDRVHGSLPRHFRAP
jgi:hypothetical protein